MDRLQHFNPLAHSNSIPKRSEILALLLTERELERQRLQIDVAHNLANDQAIRAGFNGSGVSNNTRLIERHVSPFTHGAYWKSYDFKPFRDEKTGEVLMR
ncbi:hypothetical protein SH661x_002212 [Planctomicrobium sp. SH661]|uniref:hypothetical protein n=1 Tax=Planctomicrobium sp. SH661 TaxID=3448124 RepID=UPI003F5BA314